MATVFSVYLCQFPASNNVQITSNVDGYRRLLTTLKAKSFTSQVAHGTGAYLQFP